MKLSPEAQKLRSEYQRQWFAKNRDKRRKYMQNYWERKALQPVTVKDSVINSVTSNENEKTYCLNCFGEFTPKRKTARFCSDSCRVKYNRQKQIKQ
jgi:predicted nucleic acid-binding Zn ribbon protein